MQPFQVDVVPADEAVTEVPGIYPAQRTLDARELQLAPPDGFLSHVLRLHGIHPGQPADAGLVELYRPCGRVGNSGFRGQPLALLKQRLAKVMDVSIVHEEGRTGTSS